MTTPKPFAFVLMPFSPDFRDTYLLGIKPACEEAGYYCERLDEQIFEETMLDRIYNQISKADLIISDLTERNPNVFYETGYAHALGKRVILLTRHPDDIPFDLKHYFHIVYAEGIACLKNALRERAAYYAANPNISTRDPFEEFTVLINGRKVDWTNEPLPINVETRWIGIPGEEQLGLSIEVAFHLSDSAVDTEVDIDVRLITDALFYMSGWEISRASSQIYSTIPMPDGCVMHKPLGPIRLSLGDPDKVIFDLYPSNYDLANAPHEVTIRLISAGLRRELKLMLKITNAEQCDPPNGYPRHASC